MTRLVQQIGREFGCGDLLLVGNANRVMHQQIRKKRVSANYDETWGELGAVSKDDGNYLLPCAELSEPELAAIASNKRSAAKKRFALLASTAHDVCRALQTRSTGFTLVSGDMNMRSVKTSANSWWSRPLYRIEQAETLSAECGVRVRIGAAFPVHDLPA